jgi:hypothetical protein
MEPKDLENRFVWHDLNSEDEEKTATINAETRALAILINNVCPDGREKSLAMTKLEEVKFWANASISRYKD